mgnify:FL=1
MKKQHLLRLCALMALLYMQVYTLFAADVYSLSVAKPARMFVKTGASGHKNTFIMHNYGNIEQKNFHYKATINGKVVEEKTVTFATPLKANQMASLTISIPPQSKAGDYELVLDVTQINGKPNGSPGKIAKLPITAINKLPTCRVVFEDYTANWCPWCPSGIAIMRQMAKKHPNDFFGIVVHDRDMMGIKGYNVPATPHAGLPTVWASRANKVEGFTGELYYQMTKQRGAMMDVDVKAQWNRQGKSIDVQSTTTFRATTNNARYALAYVLIENRIQRNDWAQRNGYSGSTSYLGLNPELDYFIKSSDPIKNFVFEDVARSHIGIANGLDGSLPQSVVADRPIVHKSALNGIGDWVTVINKNNLSVVVLVIDNTTHSIVNAARCVVKPYTATDIETPKATVERVEVARFNLTGRRLSAPEPGVNIIKYSDGSVEKVFVR